MREKKLLVLRTHFGGDINFLISLIEQMCVMAGDCYNFSADEISAAIREIVACFPIYRTYIRADEGLISDEDKKIIIDAIGKAKKNCSLTENVINLNLNIFDLLQSILLLQRQGEKENEFVMRFQQITGPAMAKGDEDTAFYCFNRFIALNEVGGNPAIFGISVDAFHKTMQENAHSKPRSMLATSTHDTKRSEDIRARLVLLSEIPEIWFAAVNEWVAYNEKYHAENVPDRNTQYFLYQNIVGAWPISKERLLSFTKKAAREAKTRTSWYYPDSQYEQKLHNFIEEIFADKKFSSWIDSFAASLTKFGRINSLSQTAIKLTAPGIPDFYQGSELWNISLVDPDNRRPVDLQNNYRLFKEMKSFSVDDVMQRMEEGLPKLWLIYHTLHFRKKNPQLFDRADYFPLMLSGEKKDFGIAFLRGDKVITFVPRLIISLQGNWGDTYLNIIPGNWRNILTGENINGDKIMIADILQKFPVAILTREL